MWITFLNIKRWAFYTIYCHSWEPDIAAVLVEFALSVRIFSRYIFLLFLSVCPFFSAVLIHTRVNHGRQTSMSEPLSTFTPTAAAARRRGADVIL